MFVVVAIVAGAWIALAPLDEGVPAGAQVVVDTRPKPIQHQQGGVVLDILVGEGDRVRAGQTLLRMDTAATAAVHESVRQRYYALRAAQGRLQAERNGLARISWHADLQPATPNPLAQVHMDNQSALLASRRQALDAELRGLAESQQAQQATLASATAMLASRQQQLGLLREELDNTRPLVQEGYAPRNRLLELQRQLAEADAMIAELKGQRERSQSALAELTQRRMQRQSEFQRDVYLQLSEVLRDVDAEAQRLRAADQDMQRTEIRSPVDGHVIGLAVQSPGSVVQPAQKLMDIVPQDEGLLIEARVPPHLADRIRNGQAVDVRFAAFAHTPQLVVQGKVVSVVADALLDPQAQPTGFLARVSLTAQALDVLGERRLIPGLPAEVVFKTGERSLLAYWLHPLSKRLAESMKEE
jgi:protease secretion system membrane fusion protein